MTVTYWLSVTFLPCHTHHTRPSLVTQQNVAYRILPTIFTDPFLPTISYSMPAVILDDPFHPGHFIIWSLLAMAKYYFTWPKVQEKGQHVLDLWPNCPIYSQIKIGHMPCPKSVVTIDHKHSFHWLYFTTSMSSCLILQLTLPSSLLLTVWRPSVSCNKCGWCLMSEPKSLLVDTRRSRVHYFDVGAVMSWLAVILCNVLVRIINIHHGTTTTLYPG